LALAELPAELRQPVIDYADAKRAEHAARSALSAELTRDGYRWRDVDLVGNKLAVA
jgi:hypothetical protein